MEHVNSGKVSSPKKVSPRRSILSPRPRRTALIRAVMEKYPKVHVSVHPLMAHKMTVIRDKGTAPREFRSHLSDITFYLGYEATTDLSLIPKSIETPIAPYQGKEIHERCAIIPILRAGLGMVDSMVNLMPKAAVYHIGMYRHKNSLLPIEYYRRLPKKCDVDVAVVLEPMIATAGTVNAVVTTLKNWGVKRIKVIALIASEDGVSRFCADHPDVEVYVGDIDAELTEEGEILPGLGDAGDRQFRTFFENGPELPALDKKRRLE